MKRLQREDTCVGTLISNYLTVLIGGSITHHSGAGQQLAVAGLLPTVLHGVGALVGYAPQHNVFAFLHGAFGVAPGLGRLHCGAREWRRVFERWKNNSHNQVANWRQLGTTRSPPPEASNPVILPFFVL